MSAILHYKTHVLADELVSKSEFEVEVASLKKLINFVNLRFYSKMCYMKLQLSPLLLYVAQFVLLTFQ